MSRVACVSCAEPTDNHALCDKCFTAAESRRSRRKRATDRVVLCAVEYRISRPEPWSAVFTQEYPIGCRPTRFMLHRDRYSLWQFQHNEGWGDVPCAHIVKAYEWCKLVIGGDHDQDPKEALGE